MTTRGKKIVNAALLQMELANRKKDKGEENINSEHTIDEIRLEPAFDDMIDDIAKVQNEIGEAAKDEAEKRNKTEVNKFCKMSPEKSCESTILNVTKNLNQIEKTKGLQTASENVRKFSRNKENRSPIDPQSPQCSFWKSSGIKHGTKLKLKKITKTGKQQAFESDDFFSAENGDDSDADPDFNGTSNNSSTSDSSFYEEKKLTEIGHERGKRSTAEDVVVEEEVRVVLNELAENQDLPKKTKKRKANLTEWKKEKAKILRNSGKGYLSSAKVPKEVRGRAIQQPCGDKCKVKCANKISQDMRQRIFDQYWNLANLQLQREYISKSMNVVRPAYRYPREGSHRGLNHAFYFTISGKLIRVCKMFFKAILDITDRPIRTVIKKNTDGFVAADQRGKHGKHRVLNPDLGASIREHINSIPKIESHYLRAQTTREYIEGGKTIAGLHRDYMEQCIQNNVSYGNLTQYSRIFNNEFNLSFFTPKKDQCELCVAYNNAQDAEKCELKEKYETHLREKELSREQKRKYKELTAVNKRIILATYDLQAVLPAPRGEVSVFYYKSKINSYNFTISDMQFKNVACYFWHEGEANRGANEIGTCVMNYIKQTAELHNDENVEMIFFSDNCCGQQKNKFIISMYLYAVQKFTVKSITHNFLIKGHTQNEGDNVHAVIEKSVKQALKSGPIYHPMEYARIIRSAKKTGVPYKVMEMSHSDFTNLKDLAQQIGPNFSKTTENESIKMGDIKIIKVLKDEPGVIYIKTSYEQEFFKKINVFGKRKHPVNFTTLNCKPAYSRKINIPDRKKTDIQDLINGNHIPKFYEALYNTILNKLMVKLVILI
ncbi:uncharacterized protein LOC135129438 [Zophobas morio]|uniref:uncharacterized protein LOC135129438 n=1 Tax=Zophobas morio TaxID=2755281 RepID=UPI0030829002